MGYNIKYKCLSCGEEFKLNVKPKFCPYCSSENITIDSKSRDSALKMIEEHNKLVDEMLVKFDEYAQIYARVEYLRCTLRTYKTRGIIFEEEMPKIVKPHLLDYLKKYQKQKNDRI